MAVSRWDLETIDEQPIEELEEAIEAGVYSSASEGGVTPGLPDAEVLRRIQVDGSIEGSPCRGCPPGAERRLGW